MTKPPSAILAFVLVATPVVAANGAEKKSPLQRYPLDERQIEMALAFGTKAKGKMTGLSLKDSAQSFLRGMSAMSGPGGATPTTGFQRRSIHPLHLDRTECVLGIEEVQDAETRTGDRRDAGWCPEGLREPGCSQRHHISRHGGLVRS